LSFLRAKLGRISCEPQPGRVRILAFDASGSSGGFSEKFCKNCTAIESCKAIKRHAIIERNTAIERPSVNSAVSLRTFANSPSVPIVVPVDLRQEYPAKPRLLAISEIDRAALNNCRRAAVPAPHPPRRFENIRALGRGI
jgi:hypothetical protein